MKRVAKIFPFLRWWPMVNRTTTRADLMAGLTGAILGLPQGVAFAILAGLPPEYVIKVVRNFGHHGIRTSCHRKALE
jgi:MFS superfamily sulfate permease-like transporter